LMCASWTSWCGEPEYAWGAVPSMFNPTTLNDPVLDALVSRLHEQSAKQAEEISTYFAMRARETRPITPDDPDKKRFMSDKLVALDREKAYFCYQLCRAIDARRVVEIGTSYGVSTLYLAAALRDNGRDEGGTRVVIGTEYEPLKAGRALEHLRSAGLSEYVDLRVGDLRETLAGLKGPLDFVLVDIWTPMARPAIEVVAPHLRTGAIVVCDNTDTYQEEYSDYFTFINDKTNRFSTMTLPFRGGLELTVRI
jgi:predicted O-methyltransferase YrrM